GLKDTVKALGETDRPCGIRAASPSAVDLEHAVREAVRIYTQDKALLNAMISNAMEQDVSWDAPSSEYADLYRICKKREK
ncbi:MAG TPA: starch synthase, partial [Deltaproteobacteria bacterium]|nr:starch synthase [Deltaproteobacteria bacterium]